MSTDLTFITNEAGKNLSDRFAVLLGADTRFFDCLVGYLFISGFYKLHPSLNLRIGFNKLKYQDDPVLDNGLVQETIS